MGNLWAGNLIGTNLTGTLLTAAQPNITSTGNLSVANIATANITTLANVTATTAATSNITGALRVAGGVGIVGNAFVGGLMTVTGNVTGGNLTTAGLVNATGNVTGGNIITVGSITSSSKTAGVGYATGAGNVVTQLTSKSTPVTLNALTGRITANAESLAATTSVSFNMVNSGLGASDIISINHVSGGTFGAYNIQGRVANAGNATINIYNVTAGALAEAIVIGFVVIKGAVA